MVQVQLEAGFFFSTECLGILWFLCGLLRESLLQVLRPHINFIFQISVFLNVYRRLFLCGYKRPNKKDRAGFILKLL